MQILKNSVTLIILLCICLSLVSCNSVGDDTIDSTNTESGSNSVYISDVQKDTTDITEVIDNAGQVDPDRDNLYTDENYDYE